MRIGTWNLAGRWQPQHEEFIAAADCDVWLLTEVNERVQLDGYTRHLTEKLMAAKRRWAGVYSRSPLTPLPDPHVASAAAEIDGVTYCSTILPWAGSGGEPTWPGAEPPRNVHSGRMRYALEVLLGGLPPSDLVWGGDWNQSLDGRKPVGSLGGRQHLLAAIDKLGLQVPTTDLPHRLDGLLSIDHIGVAADRAVTGAEHLSAVGLSDHDCYVVDLAG
jgi:hypothetical protein